ncbi:hypothetical protein HMPREF9946_03108 [Acetobacteraceae bacterium AT-5844]|nr:hypothetical protein HMPREF9946_03108 [Acetobacteraceae bacterium AT-5844]
MHRGCTFCGGHAFLPRDATMRRIIGRAAYNLSYIRALTRCNSYEKEK